MSELPYLVRLGTRLNAGLAALSDERKDRHAAFVLSTQLSDGGFRGREGDSDLYYTSFAIRALWMLDRLSGPVIDQATRYLRQAGPAELATLDLMNWLSTALALQLAGGENLVEDLEVFRESAALRLEATRTADGGYAKSTEGAAGSTYQSFLVLLTYQLLGLSLPRRNALIQFLYDRQRDDGGFVEIAPMKRSGTNPTAAAAATLGELGALDPETRRDITAFLREVKNPEEGGFQANTRVPFADSLSTFTAILTAQDLQLPDAYSSPAILNWVTSQLEFPTGGFRAAAWDVNADVEYTFYGLGLLALLNS
ncbi:prenyltransferase/squalene oxidase repeat-containing protein [Planctomicrobium piriforme]|uniref:Geranylgeranyl transferase type-2 subunit beta n=1 Tax=Planctomicrobium piriforme TaxID=1576369 RepID=A0A1I3RQG7_9PLAN|nr:prenyltransferase/squalene oxidase repeat-containing protein [Planctomicrobium piriforme]SFJ47521.1 geranylgeranyl transferase type-2 subunit beta [Planctomicrobium piriforme]